MLAPVWPVQLGGFMQMEQPSHHSRLGLEAPHSLGAATMSPTPMGMRRSFSWSSLRPASSLLTAPTPPPLFVSCLYGAIVPIIPQRRKTSSVTISFQFILPPPTPNNKEKILWGVGRVNIK